MASKQQLYQLAEKFEKAGYGKEPLDPVADLAILGIAQLPESYTSRATLARQPRNEWENFCAYVYETVSGTAHPGTHCKGRGFRSQEYGRSVAVLLRRLAADIKDEPPAPPPAPPPPPPPPPPPKKSPKPKLPKPLAEAQVVNGFYRTIRDMQNPFPDKNSKRVAHLSVIPAGTQCKVMRHPEGRGSVTFRDGTMLYFLNLGEQGEMGYISGTAFMSNLEAIPDNVHTLLQAGCGMPGEHVLAYLVEEHKVSLDSIRKAVKTITEMGDKEVNWMLAKHWLA